MCVILALIQTIILKVFFIFLFCGIYLIFFVEFSSGSNGSFGTQANNVKQGNRKKYNKKYYLD